MKNFKKTENKLKTKLISANFNQNEIDAN